MTRSTAHHLHSERVWALALAYWRLKAKPKVESGTGCAAGFHFYRLIRLGPDGSDDGAEYRCEDCGSTDPEGDSAR